MPAMNTRKLVDRLRSRVKCRAIRLAPDTLWNSGTSCSTASDGRDTESGSRNRALLTDVPKRFTAEGVGEGVRLAQIPCLQLLPTSGGEPRP